MKPIMGSSLVSRKFLTAICALSVAGTQIMSLGAFASQTGSVNEAQDIPIYYVDAGETTEEIAMTLSAVDDIVESTDALEDSTDQATVSSRPSLFVPLWKKVLMPAGKSVGRGVKYVATKTWTATKAVGKNTAKFTVKAGKTIHSGTMTAAKAISKGTVFVATKVKNGVVKGVVVFGKGTAQFAKNFYYDFGINHVVKGATVAGKATYKYFLRPLAYDVSYVVVAVSKGVYKGVKYYVDSFGSGRVLKSENILFEELPQDIQAEVSELAELDGSLI